MDPTFFLATSLSLALSLSLSLSLSCVRPPVTLFLHLVPPVTSAPLFLRTPDTLTVLGTPTLSSKANLPNANICGAKRGANLVS